jgi:pyridoxamine 5'-phosphate oxidase
MPDSEEGKQTESLSKADVDLDPIIQFNRWFEQAMSAGLKLPNAMTLATADKEGRPSARMVLLKGFDHSGFVFYTNFDSSKGRELSENPYAALVFYWTELDKQVRITGRVARVTQLESDEYFASRPRDSQLSAWASFQSSVVENRAVLESRMEELERQYGGREVSRPPHWGGYRLVPETIEFWQNRTGRLHDRIRYTRRSDGSGWIIERLAP